MSENLPDTADTQYAVAQQSPFSRMMATQGMNTGAIAIEQERAIAEAQGQLILAKRFPRSITGSMSEFLDTCKSPEFAATAFYTVPNRGSGPSIRFAEEAARCYGNFQYGHRELSRTEGKSEVEVYAWDMQNNNYSKRQITVMHFVDTKYGPKPCRDQADIDNLIANKASKQMRGRILALLPKHLVAAGQEACKRTLLAVKEGQPIEKSLAERLQMMLQAFTKRFGVSQAHLEKYLKHPLDHTTLDELADLQGIFAALKDGNAQVGEYFSMGDDQASEGADTAATIAKQAKDAAAAKDAAPAAQAAKPARAAKSTGSKSGESASKQVQDQPEKTAEKAQEAEQQQTTQQPEQQQQDEPPQDNPGGPDAGDDDPF